MVSFTAQGRMGNYLFECATALAFSLKHNLDFTVPHHCSDEFHNPVYLTHLRNIKWNYQLRTIRIDERQHNYFELPFEESWRDFNILLTGYFQTEKYFKEYRKEILDAFDYPWRMNEGVVAIHNRRGDYLVLKDKHPYYGEEWINQAMSHFPGYKFKFYSDEIAWAKEIFGHREDCLFSEGKSIEEDLIDMSCCQNFINSSSTFSWWASWLSRNPDKIIITPKDWFVPGHGGLNVDDIIPETWVKL